MFNIQSFKLHYVRVIRSDIIFIDSRSGEMEVCVCVCFFLSVRDCRLGNAGGAESSFKYEGMSYRIYTGLWGQGAALKGENVYAAEGTSSLHGFGLKNIAGAKEKVL